MLDNTSHEAADRFAALSTLFDSASTGHLERCGIRHRWRCLEVGAGGGSIAAWLADRVGASGAVLATDIEPRFLSALGRPNMEVRRHDIGVDALPARAFDLVHARLVLMHVPDRDQALKRMICALRPSGWLVAEEFDSVSLPPAPDLCPSETRLDSQLALLKLLEEHGVNRLYGRQLYGALRSHGLVELRGQMVEEGYLTEDQIESDLKRLHDPYFAMPCALMWSATGRRPGKSDVP